MNVAKITAFSVEKTPDYGPVANTALGNNATGKTWETF